MPDTRWAAAAGAGALLLALVGYYGMVQLRYGYGGGTGSWIFWGSARVVGGPVFGVAGHWWRGPVHRRRAIAIGLLGRSRRRRGDNVLVVDHATSVAFIVRAAGAARLRAVARDRLAGTSRCAPRSRSGSRRGRPARLTSRARPARMRRDDVTGRRLAAYDPAAIGALRRAPPRYHATRPVACGRRSWPTGPRTGRADEGARPRVEAPRDRREPLLRARRSPDVYYNLWTLRFDGDGRCVDFVEYFNELPKRLGGG